MPHVIVTHPNSPTENHALYRMLGEIFDAHERAERLVAELQRELDACRATPWPAERVLYLIWKDPWMAVASDTYIARTLAYVGWNVTIPPGGCWRARYPVISNLIARRCRSTACCCSRSLSFPRLARCRLHQVIVPTDLIDVK